MQTRKCNDSISRKSAINAMCDACDTVTAACPHFPCKRFLAIEALPSIEAELESRNGEVLLEVPHGQDPYNMIGNYIEDHIAAIEDIIAVIEIDGVKTNQLLMVDMNVDGFFVWDNDWWEGEENVSLIDFFPVSDAQGPSK